MFTNRIYFLILRNVLRLDSFEGFSYCSKYIVIGCWLVTEGSCKNWHWKFERTNKHYTEVFILPFKSQKFLLRLEINSKFSVYKNAIRSAFVVIFFWMCVNNKFLSVQYSFYNLATFIYHFNYFVVNLCFCEFWKALFGIFNLCKIH